MAPGVNLENDVLGQAAFPLHVADELELMDDRLFRPERLGLVPPEAPGTPTRPTQQCRRQPMTASGSVPAVDGNVTLSEPSETGAVTITIDRSAKLNTLTPDMLVKLEQVVDSIASLKTSIVVLRTAGDGAFCVGADIAALSELGPAGMWGSWIPLDQGVFNRLAEMPQPTVAIIDGLAMGGALDVLSR